MSFADYSQRAEDHQKMLILVKPIGPQLKPKTFNRLFERISRVHSVLIQRHQRKIHIRYKKSYPVENIEWGDFQSHRKVLGLVGFARCYSENELTDLYHQFDDIRQQFSPTLYDSRLVIFGLNKDGGRYRFRTESLGSCSSEESTEIPVTLGDDDPPSGGLFPSPTRSKPNRTLPSFTDPLNVNALNTESNGFTDPEAADTIADLPNDSALIANCMPREANSTQIFFYPSLEECLDIEEKIQEFVSSLFWVLESKRLDRSHERSDRLILLTAPFEKKDFVGIDTDSRIYKKRCQGRLRKYQGDLSMLAGLPGEGILHYQTALEILRSSNDWLWLAAAYEGLCSASVVITYPTSEKPNMQRNLSFSAKRGSSALKEASMRTGTFPRQMQNGIEEPKPRHCLLPNDIIDKYKEAVLHYSKFKSAGIIELEASIKACRVLITQQKYLLASEFLQNVVYINLELSEEEKIQRYSTLSQLYSELGMVRKASFFRRIAAMQCVSPLNPRPAWVQCYHLLLQALDGYRVSLDPKDHPPGEIDGWPVLQLRTMHELIYSARRMGNPAISIRHLSFILHTLFDYLSEQEKKEISDILQSYTSKCEGTPQSLALDNGTILPPVSFLRFPTVKSFRLQELPPHLRPINTRVKGQGDMPSVTNSPFIYSPLQTNQHSQTKKKKVPTATLR